VSEWQFVKLADAPLEILDGDRGKNYPSQDEFSDSGYCLFLSTKNVRAIGFDFSDCQFISKERDGLLRKGRLQRNDIVLTTRGTIGNLGFFNEKVSYERIRINSGMVIIRPDVAKLLPAFNFYTFRKLQSDFLTFTSGSAQPQLPIRDLKEIEISIPSLEEQKAIASVLSSLDDKIDLLHRQNATLEAMAETLFRQWFVEEAQEDWEERPLKEVCLINNGYAFQSETYKETGQKIIRTMNFNNHWIEFNSLVYISEELAKSFDKYYLKRNDFLLVMVGASLGNFAIVTDDVIPSLQNQNMWCFRAHENLFQHYLNFAMRNIINDALHGASGSAREFFQKGVFYEIKIPTPPNELILKFHEISESYFAKIELNRKQIQTLEKLRDNLLPKLMSGEFRVNYSYYD
jgi:type I restriction enzyme S subunit